MRCKYCGVSIDDDSKICPLCHELAVDDGKKTNSNFPPKTEKLRKTGSRVNFHNLYISIAILVAGICVALNMTLTPGVYWFTIVMAVLAYGYLTVANTVMSNSSIWIKIFWQILMITLILWAAQSALNSWFDESTNWLLDYALPVILGISVIALSVTAASLIRKEPSLLVDNLLISLIGFLPIILYAANVIESVIPAAICAGLCGVSIMCFIAFARDELWAEIVRRFHF